MKTLNRRIFLKQAGLLGLLSMAPSYVRGEVKKNRNIILYIADDLGMNDAGCFGNPVIQTPGLDELAREGVRFDHAFCTTPSCSPSRSVILTGKHNHANGMYGLSHWVFNFKSLPGTESLPKRLSRAGYRTACVGKYHVAPEEVYPFDKRIPLNVPTVMADRARKFIEADTERPFFICFATMEPHRPFPREGADPVDPEDVIVPDYLPDLPECRQELAEYYESAQRGDAGLQRLIEHVKATGHWENTLIVFVSDNGIAFPGAKTNLYEPGIRLPMVVRHPGLKKAGHVNHAMISYTDITPTILDYAGVGAEKEEFHGRSFLPILEKKNPGGWDEVYASHSLHEVTMYYPMRMVRNRRFKLIWNIAYGLEFPHAMDLWDSKTWQAVRKRKLEMYGKRKVKEYLHRPEFELYDLASDPDEIHNLAGLEKYKGVLQKLQGKIQAFQHETADPWAIKWEHE